MQLQSGIKYSAFAIIPLEREAMLEKLVQAAIITFLLHLLAAINLNTSTPDNPSPSLSNTPSAFVLANKI
jgi:hypothetical protein